METLARAAYRLLDFGVCGGGVSLVVIGTLLTTVLLIPFRRNERWGWWATWALPAWATSVFLLNLAFGWRRARLRRPP